MSIVLLAKKSTNEALKPNTSQFASSRGLDENSIRAVGDSLRERVDGRENRQ